MYPGGHYMFHHLLAEKNIHTPKGKANQIQRTGVLVCATFRPVVKSLFTRY